MDCKASTHNLLERMLPDTSVEPTKIPLALLSAITNGFSDDRKIGSGGFAVVYKGELQNGTVAVKKLFNKLAMDEEKFIKEILPLKRVKHENIVRFLGYYAGSEGETWDHEGKMVIAYESHWLLCFEFLPKGSLDNYITDASEGLEWRTRYQIIKGICEGVHCLHQNNIVHLDLKPANILLNDDMVPKIADFGLSRCFDEKQSKTIITSNLFGTKGYLAPECYGGRITYKSDIYSLGVIITEILTGQKGYPEIENVLQGWSTRFKTSCGDKWLALVRVCTDIGIKCSVHNPNERPHTGRIIEMLNKMESEYGFTETEIRSLGSTEISKLLDVHPLELRFPWEPNKRVQCPVSLTNRTEKYVGVWIRQTNPDTRSDLHFPVSLAGHDLEAGSWSSLLVILEPHSTLVEAMTLKEQQQPPSQYPAKFDVLMIVMGSREDLENLKPSISGYLNMDNNFSKRVKELGGEVHRAMLTAVICHPTSCQEAYRSQKYFIPAASKFGDIVCIDVHPTETWILVGHTGSFTNEDDVDIECSEGYVSIWNYETQKMVTVLQVIEKLGMLNHACPIHSAKFIAREQWFAAGDEGGCVHVYAYTTKDKVMEFEAYKDCSFKLAVHPTDPFLLTGGDTWIKLWDWSKGWACTRFFNADSNVYHLMFNPRDRRTFASVSDDGTLKVWDIDSSNPITTLPAIIDCYWTCLSNVEYLSTDSHRPFLVTCRYNNDKKRCAEIWDSHTSKLVHTLEVSGRVMQDVACHPTLPLFVTLLDDKYGSSFCLWNASTYRLEKVHSMSFRKLQRRLHEAMLFTGTKDLTRIVFTSGERIAVIEFDLPTLLGIDQGEVHSASEASTSGVSKLADGVQPMGVSTAPSQLQQIVSVPKGPEEASSSQILSSGSTEISKLLDVHPSELRFTFGQTVPSNASARSSAKTKNRSAKKSSQLQKIIGVLKGHGEASSSQASASGASNLADGAQAMGVSTAPSLLQQIVSVPKGPGETSKSEPIGVYTAPSQLQQIASVPKGPGETSSSEPMGVSTAPSQLQRIVSVPNGPEETGSSEMSKLLLIRSLGSTEISKLLDVHPLELRFHFEPNKLIQCPVNLINRTDQYVGVWIRPAANPDTPSDLQFPVSLADKDLKAGSWSSLLVILEPHSTLVEAMTLLEEQQQPQDPAKFEVLMIVIGSVLDLRNLESFISGHLNLDSDFLKRVEELGGQVHRAMLTAAVLCDPASCQEVIRNQKHFIPATLEPIFGNIVCIDVHPTETWILVGHKGYHTNEDGTKIDCPDGYVSIWNYETQEIVTVLQVMKEPGMLNQECWITSAKFIAREQRFASGDETGWVHVYAYTTKDNVKVKEFQAYDGCSVMLAVHPTDPFLLTGSDGDTWIKLWDWSKGWQCTRRFDVYSKDGVPRLMFNPRDPRTFASVSNDRTLKVWDIGSSNPITTLPSRENAEYLFTDSHRNFLVTCGYNDHNWCADIWDSQTSKLVHNLEVSGRRMRDVACHPILPLFVTLLDDANGSSLCLWNASTYRLEKMVHSINFLIHGHILHGAMLFTGTKDLTRLVVGSEPRIAVMEINLPTARTDGGNEGF